VLVSTKLITVMMANVDDKGVLGSARIMLPLAGCPYGGGSQHLGVLRWTDRCRDACGQDPA
jgi:hypothetical protein